MSSPNIFAEDWQACLHAHYLHVLCEDNMNNEASLRLVLMQVGFDEEALHGMRAEIQAVAPDSELEVAEVQPVEQVVEMVAEEVISEEVIPEVVEEATSDPDISMTVEAPADEDELPPPPRDDPKPSQLSLF